MGENETQAMSDIEAIKRLFVLLLLDRGYSQEQLAKVVGTSQSGISRMFPGGVPKKKAK